MDTDDEHARHAQALAEINIRIEADNVVLRERFLAEVPCYSHDDVIAKFGQDVAESDRTIFVDDHGRRHYPCFQFDQAGVLLNVEAALARLRANMSQWQIAFWFVSSNAWLDGKAPQDVLVGRDASIDLLIDDIQAGLVGKPYDVFRIAGGWRMQTRVPSVKPCWCLSSLKAMWRGCFEMRRYWLTCVATMTI